MATNFSLPSDVKLIPENERNPESRYLIPPVTGFVFPFSFPAGYDLLIIVGDSFFSRRQDLSMAFWIGTKPWDKADVNIKLVHNTLHLRKQGSDFVFYDKALSPPPQGTFENPRPKILVPETPDTTFYANVRNIVNQENSFELYFVLQKRK